MKHTILLLSATAASVVPGVLSLRELRHRATICGARGYDAGTSAYDDSSSKGTYAACSAWCQKSTSCKSFAYGSGECYVYSVAVTGNFQADSGSPYLFYDRACISASSTTTATITTTTTTAAKSITAASRSALGTSKITTSTTKATTSLSPTTTDCGGAPTTALITSKITTKSSTLSTKVTSSSTIPKPTTAIATTSNLAPRSTSIALSTTTTPFSTPPCPLPTWIIHDFTFFNSSQNLDCAGSDGSNDLCETGRDPQPAGYGPPDYISVTVDGGIGYCHQQNPGSVPLREVGNNVVRCGGSQIQLTFYGNSNSPSSTARFDLQNPVYCDNGCSYGASGSVNVPMNCVYDSGHNATCTINPSTVSVVPTTFGNVACSSNDDSDDSDDGDDDGGDN